MPWYKRLDILFALILTVIVMPGYFLLLGYKPGILPTILSAFAGMWVFFFCLQPSRIISGMGEHANVRKAHIPQMLTSLATMFVYTLSPAVAEFVVRRLSILFSNEPPHSVNWYILYVTSLLVILIWWCLHILWTFVIDMWVSKSSPNSI